ncbi:hypothetical protein NP233_g1199 [Leucocoprinus birnbaumii]|uniref:Pali-domain-containing protein n=1 Tax=Leucocoprinus birnbaumii TaxID=56174 RepID=A0AAD5W5U7_9AGAR|nr:hypothetical protein NP233_g1199 [Leucocoprinus birnbaumii]
MVRPLQEYRLISAITCFLLFLSFLLLLLVGLSLPIIKPIYLVVFKSVTNAGPITSVATQLRFGVWGLCAFSNLNLPSVLNNNGFCLGPRLGYEVPSAVQSLIGVSNDVVNAVEVSLRVVLVLHPVAAGLAFVAFITSLFLASHAVSILTLFISIVAALLVTIVFGIDLALVLVARNQVKNLEDLNFEVDFGNGVWMVLAALILIWVSVILLSARACYCCGVVRREARKERY